jgi:hypothetical protein
MLQSAEQVSIVDVANIQNAVVQFLTIYAKKLSLASEPEIIIKTGFAIEIFSNSQFDKASAMFKASNLPVISLSECSNILKNANPSEGDPIVMIIQWGFDLTNLETTNGIQYLLFSGYSRTPIDLAQCANTKSAVLLPISQLPSVQEKWPVIQQFQPLNMDIFNPASPLFTDRCYRYSDGVFSYTVGMRVKSFFPGKQLLCGQGCAYQGITSDAYAVCQCQINSSNSAFVQNASITQNAYEFAGDLYKCNFNPTTDIVHNFGFWSLVVVHGVLLICSLIMLLTGFIKSIVNGHLDSVITFNVRNHDQPDGGDGVTIPDKEMQEKAAFSYSKYDFEEMSLTLQKMESDGRSFCGFFMDTLRRTNYLIAPFFSQSLIKPYWVRTYELLCWFSIVFFFNAFFFWDKYLDGRLVNQYTWLAMAQIWAKELDKSLWAVLATYPFMLVLGYLLRIGSSHSLNLNETLKSNDKEKIVTDYCEYIKGKSVGYIISWVIFSTIIAFFSYYTVLYNAFYINNTMYWFFGSVVSSVFYLIVFQPLTCVLYAISWKLAHKATFFVYLFAFFRFFMHF